MGGGGLNALPPLPVTRIALYSAWRLIQGGLCSSRPQGPRLHRTLDRCASDKWELILCTLGGVSSGSLHASSLSKTALGSRAPNPDCVS